MEVSINNVGVIPNSYFLHQNYPNPFNPETSFQIDLPKSSMVTISIYNIRGQKVATLLDKNLNSGSHKIKWNGYTSKGNALSSGMYFYEMVTKDYQAIKKLIKFDEDNHETPLFTDTSEFRHTEAFTNALTLYTNCLNSFNGKRYQANKEYETPIIPETVEVEPGKQKSECQKSYDNPELPKPEGVLAAIMNYILKNSYIEQPAFCFSAALSLLATLSGRKFEFEGVAPNLYLLNLHRLVSAFLV